METYFQYLETEKDGDQAIAREADSIIGARPFGEGLLQMAPALARLQSRQNNARRYQSSEKVPVMSCSLMWEPYAGLRYLHKPVDSDDVEY